MPNQIDIIASKYSNANDAKSGLVGPSHARIYDQSQNKDLGQRAKLDILMVGAKTPSSSADYRPSSDEEFQVEGPQNNGANSMVLTQLIHGGGASPKANIEGNAIGATRFSVYQATFCDPR